MCLRPSVVQTQLWRRHHRARPALNFDQQEASGCQDEQIDLVDPPLVVHELEVRPAAAGSWSGKCSRRNSRASRSHSYEEALTIVQRGGFMGFYVPYGCGWRRLLVLWFGRRLDELSGSLADDPGEEASRATAISLSVR